MTRIKTSNNCISQGAHTNTIVNVNRKWYENFILLIILQINQKNVKKEARREKKTNVQNNNENDCSFHSLSVFRKYTEWQQPTVQQRYNFCVNCMHDQKVKVN